MDALGPGGQIFMGVVAFAVGLAALRWPSLYLTTDPDKSRLIASPPETGFDRFKNWWVLKGVPLFVGVLPGAFLVVRGIVRAIA